MTAPRSAPRAARPLQGVVATLQDVPRVLYMLLLVHMVTGFPEQIVFDNTDGTSDAILPSGTVSIDPTHARAVSWSFTDADPDCGPGGYALSVLTLALSAPSSGTATIALALYRYNATASTMGTLVGRVCVPLRRPGCDRQAAATCR